MEHEDVVEVLVHIVSRYDILLVQEIRDNLEEAIFDLLKAVNESIDLDEDTYDVILSDRMGRSYRYQEQYAFFYRKSM